jgi:ABC-2 type transport system permease protein
MQSNNAKMQIDTATGDRQTEHVVNRESGNRAYKAYFTEIRYELLRTSRAKIPLLSILTFPIGFYLIFGVANRAEVFHGHTIARYLIASYSCFGGMGAAFFAVGVSVAYERGQGWLELKRSSPLPTGAYLVSKLIAAVAYGIVITMTLITLGLLTTHMHLSFLEIVGLLSVNSFGVLIFATIALFLGLYMPPQSAGGLVNLVYLPLALFSGLWMPIEFLPHWIQKIALVLPSYYYSRISLHVLGYFDEPVMKGILVMGAYAVVFIILGAIAFRHQESKL